MVNKTSHYWYKPKDMTRTPADKHIATLARIIFGCYFMYSAIIDMSNFGEIVASNGFQGAGMLLIIGITVKFFFGAMLAMRYHTKYVAIILATYLVLVSITFHNPIQWSVNEFSELIFMRNIAIVCGLLFIYSHSRSYTEWQKRIEPY
ncbi:MAG: putative membrane protein YphA (DoxX/SURF4 family) [Acidimicrobiales bacterium]|jgi:uncharacterized membrane protein YphA (DoxX/SURF4 family)